MIKPVFCFLQMLKYWQCDEVGILGFMATRLFFACATGSVYHNKVVVYKVFIAILAFCCYIPNKYLDCYFSVPGVQT